MVLKNCPCANPSRCWIGILSIIALLESASSQEVPQATVSHVSAWLAECRSFVCNREIVYFSLTREPKHIGSMQLHRWRRGQLYESLESWAAPVLTPNTMLEVARLCEDSLSGARSDEKLPDPSVVALASRVIASSGPNHCYVFDGLRETRYAADAKTWTGTKVAEYNAFDLRGFVHVALGNDCWGWMWDEIQGATSTAPSREGDAAKRICWKSLSGANWSRWQMTTAGRDTVHLEVYTPESRETWEAGRHLAADSIEPTEAGVDRYVVFLRPNNQSQDRMAPPFITDIAAIEHSPRTGSIEGVRELDYIVACNAWLPESERRLLQTAEPPDLRGKSIGLVRDQLRSSDLDVAAARVTQLEAMAREVNQRTHDPGVVEKVKSRFPWLLGILALFVAAVAWRRHSKRRLQDG